MNLFGARIIAGVLAATDGGPFIRFFCLPRFPRRRTWHPYLTAVVWRNLPLSVVFVVRA